MDLGVGGLVQGGDAGVEGGFMVGLRYCSKDVGRGGARPLCQKCATGMLFLRSWHFWIFVESVTYVL